MYGGGGTYGKGAPGGGEGTVIVPVRVVAADPLPTSYRDIEWDPPAGKTITAYRVYYTEPGGSRTLYGTYAGDVLSARVADLSPDKAAIVFEVEGDYTATAVGSAVGSTAAITGFVERRTSVYPAAFTNGMFEDQEPEESEKSGIPLITVPGRTCLSNFNNAVSNGTRASGRYAYGLRFMLGNMTLNPIAGGKMIVGLTVGWNGQWTPRIGGVTNNVVTGNLMTGWQRVTIGGDESLPIPAAEARASGMNLRCVWTDWLVIPGGWHLGQAGWDFLTRFLLPPRSVAPYALTHATWDPVDTFIRNGVLAGRNQARADMWVASGSSGPVEYHLRAEGDYVSDPTVLANITTVAGQCPAAGDTFYKNKYGPMGIAGTPLLAIEYALDPSEVGL